MTRDGPLQDRPNVDPPAPRPPRGGDWDLPPQILAWAPKFLVGIVANEEESRDERIRALRLLLKMQDGRRRAGPATQVNIQQNFQTAGGGDELAAVRAHLVSLALGGEEETTEELARRAALEIIEWRSGLRTA